MGLGFGGIFALDCPCWLHNMGPNSTGGRERGKLSWVGIVGFVGPHSQACQAQQINQT